MENAPCKNFCGVLISFNEVLKLQSFEFDASDIKPANALIVSFYIINFRENNEVSTKFHGVFCHGVIKWESFGWFNYVSTLVTSSTQMNLLNMLILAFMLRFGNFGWWNFFLWWKTIILNKSCYFRHSSTWNARDMLLRRFSRIS